MLPSGKVEFSVQEILPHVPEGFIQSADTLGDFALSTFTLPLYQVASRIPKDAMMLRGDQRPVDSSVMVMEEPFSPEMLGRAAMGAQPVEEYQQPQAEPQPEPAYEIPEPAYIQEEPAPQMEVQAEPQFYQPEAELPQQGADEAQFAPPVEALYQGEAEAQSAPAPDLSFDPAMLAAAEAELAGQVPGPLMAEETLEHAATAEELGVTLSSQVETPENSSEMPVAPASQIDWANALADLNAATEAAAQQEQQQEQQQMQVEESIPVEAVQEPLTSGPGNPFIAGSSDEEIPADLMVEDRETPVPLPQGSLMSKLPPLESALSAQTRPIPLPLFKKTQNLREPLRPPPPPVLPKENQEMALPPAAVRSTGKQTQSFMKEASRTQRLHFINLSPAVNNLLGVPPDEEIKLKDVVEQIRRWPGVQGCIIAGRDGLPITSVTDDRGFAQSLSAFAPKILARVNELFTDLGMPAAEEVHIPASGTSTFIYRYEDVYFILLHREASVPQWYSTIIRQVLTEISASKKNG